MGFQIGQDILRLPSGVTHPLCTLADRETGSRVSICPEWGFNCISWQVQSHGKLLELLWSDFSGATPVHPTRCGIPILFPFPNRIRGGKFLWTGKSYQLMINDAQGCNAIHGFACNQPWRVTAQGSDSNQAWLTGEFNSSNAWPAAFQLQATYRLTTEELRLEFRVKNTDQEFLPFGLGLHPYFRVAADAALLQLMATNVADGESPHWERWELQDCLPTGTRRPLDEHHVTLIDSISEPLGKRHFDDAYRLTAGSDTILRVQLLDSNTGKGIQVRASPDFRDLVLFTPPHRQAVCVEPYTCVTDAINLPQQGVDAGLKVLPPGESWHGWVTFEPVYPA